MTREKLSNDFFEEMLAVEAWGFLSENFRWTEAMLEKYMDKIDWVKLSRNYEMMWTPSILEKYKGLLCWNSLSGNFNKNIFSDANLDRYENYWNWSTLSSNRHAELTIETIEKYASRWDWVWLIRSYSLPNTSAIEFIERFISNITVSELKYSSLWDKAIKAKADELMQEVIS